MDIPTVSAPDLATALTHLTVEFEEGQPCVIAFTFTRVRFGIQNGHRHIIMEGSSDQQQWVKFLAVPVSVA